MSVTIFQRHEACGTWSVPVELDRGVYNPTDWTMRCRYCGLELSHEEADEAIRNAQWDEANGVARYADEYEEVLLCAVCERPSDEPICATCVATADRNRRSA